MVGDFSLQAFTNSAQITPFHFYVRHAISKQALVFSTYNHSTRSFIEAYGGRIVFKYPKIGRRVPFLDEPVRCCLNQCAADAS